MAYLDYNATTPLCPDALSAMEPYLSSACGNPSSIHAAGRRARAAVDDARERFADLLGVRPHEIIFTSGGTEADNLAILGLARASLSDKRHIVTVQSEHHAVLHAFDHLEASDGFEVTRLPVDALGVIDLDYLQSVIRPDTALVSVMSANNETGTLQPMDRVADICRSAGVVLHSDMIQSFGKEDCSSVLERCDAASFAAHKFYGPPGAGALVLRSGLTCAPLHFGGSHENGRRPGTENVAAVAGLAAAAEHVVASIEREQNRQANLRDRLWNGIRFEFPNARRNGHPEASLANTLNVSFPGVDGESLLIGLDLEGVEVSSGSACMVGSIMPSHVLMAMGVPRGIAASTVRFSMGEGTTDADIAHALTALGKVLKTQESLT